MILEIDSEGMREAMGERHWIDAATQVKIKHPRLPILIASSWLKNDATALLMTSSLPASKVGYASVTSFSKRFTECYGTEPSTFR